MKLSSVFSSGAVLLQNAVTEFKGRTKPNSEVFCSLFLGEKLIRCTSVFSLDDGAFSVALLGEDASYSEYRIEFCCCDEKIILTDILYGELWLAAGESNMKMPNRIMENKREFLATAKKFKLRYYRFTTHGEEFENNPFEEAEDAKGEWISSSDEDKFSKASATASAAILVVAERFASEEKEIPVGIIDTSIASTTIEAWLPMRITDGVLKQLLTEAGRYTPEEKRRPPYKDLHGANSIFYNTVIAPLKGIKARGMLWCHGENDIGNRPLHYLLYKKALENLYSEYSLLFAESKGAHFVLICSLLFAFPYKNDSSANIGQINRAICDAASENPGKISAVPIHDLPAKWSYFYNYEPIHPTNKYGVGERLGRLMLSNSYGDEGIKTAAYFKKSVRKKGAIELHFETFGNSLYCIGNHLRGFYIGNKNGVYIPADAEIISRTAVRVSSEYISSPANVCYQFGDLQNDGNLYCGEFPVAPFTTETKNSISLSVKPWIYADTDSQFHLWEGDSSNIYNYPIRFPSEGSAICYDGAYDAIRLVNTENGAVCGMYIKSQAAMPLDLYNYSALVFSLYSRPEVKVEVKLTLRQGEKQVVRICEVNTRYTEGTGIIECKTSFRISPDILAEKLEILVDTSELPHHTVAIGNIALIPKKNV